MNNNATPMSAADAAYRTLEARTQHANGLFREARTVALDTRDFRDYDPRYYMHPVHRAQQDGAT
jgi:hypothetical protein